MTTRPAIEEAIADSQKLLVLLEQHAPEVPYLDGRIAHHCDIQAELERCSAESRDAVEAWRAALARRWDCEVAGRRLYKQNLRQMTEFFGEGAPQVTLLSRGGAEANSTPNELYEDLLRLQAGLQLQRAVFPGAHERSQAVGVCATELNHAIEIARRAELRRRSAVLDGRMACETFRRAWEQTFTHLADHYGDPLPEVFERLLVAEPAQG